MSRKRALITGITGQDGSYLTQLLLSKGYVVHGTSRSESDAARKRFFEWTGLQERLNNDLFLHTVDLTDTDAVLSLLDQIQPDEIYHLAGPSHVSTSLLQPQRVCTFATVAGTNLLEWMRRRGRQSRLFHASSSLAFGAVDHWPQDEQTPFRPTTPYGAAKAFVSELVRIYRERYGLFTCNGLLYNHESPRRHPRFVTQKICLATAAIRYGLATRLRIGNLDAQRDWGHAAEYVEAMWRMLQQPQPDDYILATGRLHRVYEIVEIAFRLAGLDPRQHLYVDPTLFRPAESYRYVGNPAKAADVLGWRACRTLEEIIAEMLQAALSRIKALQLKRHGRAAASPSMQV